MTQAFIDAAGSRPARSDAGLWRQVGLLAVAAAIDDHDDARIGLARSLLALDHPDEAGSVAAAVDRTAWGIWLGVLAVGQAGQPDRARGLAEEAREALPDSPDGREVARRLGDLIAEFSTLAGTANAGRFGLLGVSADPRRVLLVGRSSVSYLADHGAGEMGLIRFGPYGGVGAGNRAHHGLGEVIDAIGRGEGGDRREIPPDESVPLRPERMLTALSEAGRARTDELERLAEEVRLEREELARKGEELDDELARLIAERARLKRIATPNGGEVPPPPGYLPKTSQEAIAVLGIDPDASRAQIESAYRDLVRSAHPDRVAGLHPGIRNEAENLTVALNAARDILLAGQPKVG